MFCVNGGVLPNTPTPGFTLTCVATSNYRTLTLLLGGVDYTFYIQAINQRGLEGPLSEAFEYRTISVVPKSIESLQVTPVPTPDQGSGYLVGLNWHIPLEAAITGGERAQWFCHPVCRVDAGALRPRHPPLVSSLLLPYNVVSARRYTPVQLKRPLFVFGTLLRNLLCFSPG